MSNVMYIASNFPLKERANPHEKMMSVNEAIAAGIKDIPYNLLEAGFDRDKPNVIMYADREITLNVFTKEIIDGNFDDDFCIFSAEGAYGLRTDRKYCAFFEWYRFTKGRAQQFIEYLKEHLENTDEIELWHVWLDNKNTHNIETVEISTNNLTAEDIEKFDSWDLWKEPCTDLCYRITH